MFLLNFSRISLFHDDLKCCIDFPFFSGDIGSELKVALLNPQGKLFHAKNLYVTNCQNHHPSFMAKIYHSTDAQ